MLDMIQLYEGSEQAGAFFADLDPGRDYDALVRLPLHPVPVPRDAQDLDGYVREPTEPGYLEERVTTEELVGMERVNPEEFKSAVIRTTIGFALLALESLENGHE